MSVVNPKLNIHNLTWI